MKGKTRRMPSLSKISISPGSMSRTKLASMRSKAQVSEATTQPFLLCLPRDSGRMPIGSRTMIIIDSDKKANE